jgi:hypothetical protein
MFRSYDHLQAEIYGHKTETCSGYRIKYSNQCCVRRKPWTWPSTRNRMQTTNFKTLQSIISGINTCKYRISNCSLNSANYSRILFRIFVSALQNLRIKRYQHYNFVLYFARVANHSKWRTRVQSVWNQSTGENYCRVREARQLETEKVIQSEKFPDV